MTTATADPAPEPARKVSCFVIGPIGDEHAEPQSAGRVVYEESLAVYEEVVSWACRKYGIEPLRADAIADAGEVTDQIRRCLDEADIVIADVSGGNPNVMWELGFRQGQRKPVILIGEHGKLPFDISPMRTILFRRDPHSLVKARNMLDRFLAEGISKGFSAAAVRDTRGAKGNEAPAGGEQDEEDDSPGMFERLAQAEAEMGSVIADIESMTSALMDIAAVAEETSPRLTALGQSNAPMSARLAVIQQFAEAVALPTAAFRAGADAFAERMSDIDSGMQVSLDIIEAQPREERDEEVKEFLQQLIETAEITRGGITQISDFGSVMKSVVGYSRLLRGPVRDVAEAVRVVVAVTARTDTWEQRARKLL